MKLYIIGDIDYAAYEKFTEELAALEAVGEDVWIELCSDGGDSSVALAFYDRIRASPANINIVGFGAILSAASLIFAAGARRIMAPNAWLMVHEDGPPEYNSLQEATRDIKHLQRVEDQFAELMAKNSNTSIRKWKELTKKETYLSAEECVSLGIADEILKK